tara:strand:- start:240 stop:1238 length:999 start_codon:yes stop_codon:yes gene_type:complete
MGRKKVGKDYADVSAHNATSESASAHNASADYAGGTRVDDAQRSAADTGNLAHYAGADHTGGTRADDNADGSRPDGSIPHVIAGADDDAHGAGGSRPYDAPHDAGGTRVDGSTPHDDARGSRPDDAGADDAGGTRTRGSTPAIQPRVPMSYDDPTTWPGLTPIEDTWARAYARLGSMKEACITAGLIGNAVARSRALLSREEIRVAVGVYARMCASAFSVQREAIVAQLARIGFSDIGDLFDPETGDMLPPHRLPSRVRAAVASVSVTSSADGSTQHTYTLTPRVKALELLTRVLGIGGDTRARPLRVRMVSDPGTGTVTSEVRLIASERKG